VVDFIERVLDQQLDMVRFEVEEFSSMKNAEGYTDPNGEFIILREDVYEKGLMLDGRARFTAAHELGHFVLHTNIPLARAPSDAAIKKFRLSEPQANQFAAELLMPRKFLTPSDTVHSIMERHSVSFEAASNRLRYMSHQWNH
jgi:Zn-dependent peptidase ImmA (M78 family)